VNLSPGVEAVNDWIDAVLVSGDLPRAWSLMAQDFRLAVTQGLIMGVAPERTGDNEFATALADAGPASAAFGPFAESLSAHWSTVYAGLADGFGYLDQSDPLAPGLELVVVVPGTEEREISAGEPVLVHSFIVEFDSERWLVAANARRLPVPGWPPSEKQLLG
jgi:hypothetical protein